MSQDILDVLKEQLQKQKEDELSFEQFKLWVSYLIFVLEMTPIDNPIAGIIDIILCLYMKENYVSVVKVYEFAKELLEGNSDA